jgi:hypothetical protein
MRIIDIENQILEVKEKLKVIQKEQRKASLELQGLTAKKQQKYKESFLEFIEIGFRYEFISYSNLTGVQTGLKKGEKPESPHFRKGDEIEVVKKNRVSFVVRCVKKLSHKFDPSISKNVPTYTSDQTFRIDIESFYHQLTSNSEFYKQLTLYINRKDALSEILD